jgi:hypothetical protein
MQGKGRPNNIDIKFFLQSFNTPGNEITPGSDIIGKYFKGDGIEHNLTL